MALRAMCSRSAAAAISGGACRAAVQAGEPLVLPEALALRRGLSAKISCCTSEPSLLPRAPVVGAPAISPAASKATAGSVTVHQGAVLGVSWFAGPRPKICSSGSAGFKICVADVQAATPSNAQALCKAARTGLSPSQSPRSARGVAGLFGSSVSTLIPSSTRPPTARTFSAKAPSLPAPKPGRKPLGYSAAVWAIGGVASAVYYCLQKRTTNVCLAEDEEGEYQLPLMNDEHGDNQVQLMNDNNYYWPQPSSEDEDDLPEFLDWEEKGFLTPPVPFKYNFNNGVCWAIIAVQSVEASYTILTGRVVKLSIQQLLDCGIKCQSVRGGLYHLAYNDITRFGGLTTEAEYPFADDQNDRCCEMEGKHIVASIDGYYSITNTEREIMRALQYGPVAVMVYSSPGFFSHTNDSILDISKCPPGKDVLHPNGKVTSHVNHAILIVGYGTDKETGKKYWRVKNTWGIWWGRFGYGRLERGGSDWRGVAGITSHLGYQPIIREPK